MSDIKKKTGCKIVYQEGDYKDISERPELDLSVFDLILFNQDHQLDEHVKLWNINRKKCIVFPYASFIYEKPPIYKSNRYFAKMKNSTHKDLNYDLVFIGSTGKQYPFRNEVLEALKDYGTVFPNDDINGEDCYKQVAVRPVFLLMEYRTHI